MPKQKRNSKFLLILSLIMIIFLIYFGFDRAFRKTDKLNIQPEQTTQSNDQP